jgi:hypothetical protein
MLHKDTTDAISTLEKIIEDDYPEMTNVCFSATYSLYHSDSISMHVDGTEFVLYNPEFNERKFSHKKNEYEPLYKTCVREWKRIKKEIRKIKL